MAVYLKIFIQKKLGYKEFILSKYTGGIAREQFKCMRGFDILYDFSMISIVSFGSFTTISVLLFNLNNNLYLFFGLYLSIIILLIAAIPINELTEITRPKWLLKASAPQGIIMVWQNNCKFGNIYRFIYKLFSYIVIVYLALFTIVSIVALIYTYQK